MCDVAREQIRAVQSRMEQRSSREEVDRAPFPVQGHAGPVYKDPNPLMGPGTVNFEFSPAELDSWIESLQTYLEDEIDTPGCRSIYPDEYHLQ